MRRNNYDNIFNFALFNLNTPKVHRIILQHAKRNNQIIYGRQALNVQLPIPLRAMTTDYDVYTKNPKHHANIIQKELDKNIGGGKDVFFSKEAIHKGTFRVKHVGGDGIKNTRDDIEVVDYTKKPKIIRVIRINNLRYESIQSIKDGKRKILKDPKSKYRHDKDRKDVIRITEAKKLN